MKALIRVFGRVQGVFFRDFAARTGKSLGLSVVAKNLEDGSVEIFAQGSEEALESFIGKCRVGPPLARVDRIEVERKYD